VAITAPFGESFTSDQYLTAGEWYALPMQLQAVSTKMLIRHTTLLNEALAQGLPYDDERVLGEVLNILGLAYFNEVEMGDRIDNRLAQVVQVPHFALAITSRDLSIWVDAQQRPVDLDPASHSIDVRLSLGSIVSAQNPANSSHEIAWMLNAGMRGSAVEHAIHEQLRPVKAISTIQALKLAADNGQPIYYITPANQDAVIPLLSAHDPSVLDSIIADLADGRHIIISQAPATYGQWQGSGWISLDPESGSAGYLISGGLGSSRAPFRSVVSGGSGVHPEPQPPDDCWTGYAANRAAASCPFRLPNLHPEIRPWAGQKTSDPIEIATGAFIHQYPDLPALGGLGLPLSFERSYVSSRNSLSSTLGFGWNHTYNTRFYTSTDWTRGFGDRMALEAAPALASAQVGFDLFATGVISDSSFPRQRYTSEVLTAQWLMTQMTGNAITLIDSQANPNTHMRLSDGTYQPPAGGRYVSGVTYAVDGSATLSWRDGTRMQFNSTGRPSALDDANGNRTTLAYDAQGRLRQVTENVW
jgi:YD repeat-containing protein